AHCGFPQSLAGRSRLNAFQRASQRLDTYFGSKMKRGILCCRRIGGTAPSAIAYLTLTGACYDNTGWDGPSDEAEAPCDALDLKKIRLRSRAQGDKCAAVCEVVQVISPRLDHLRPFR